MTQKLMGGPSDKRVPAKVNLDGSRPFKQTNPYRIDGTVNGGQPAPIKAPIYQNGGPKK